MTGATGEGDHGLLEHVLLSVVNEADARATATAIAYRPRGGGRLMQLLSGGLSRQLVVSAILPVIAFPRTETG